MKFYLLSPQSVPMNQVLFPLLIKPFEEKLISKDIVICIDPAAIMFLIGSEMDYKEEKFSSGFEFSNPNEIARCGCGESFTVA